VKILDSVGDLGCEWFRECVTKKDGGWVEYIFLDRYLLGVIPLSESFRRLFDLA
jgi:hypothetical protein